MPTFDSFDEMALAYCFIENQTPFVIVMALDDKLAAV